MDFENRVKTYAKANKYTLRQTFLTMCDSMMQEGMSVFSPYLDIFVSICRDRIINVRVTMAECLLNQYRLGSPVLINPEIQ